MLVYWRVVEKEGIHTRYVELLEELTKRAPTISEMALLQLPWLGSKYRIDSETLQLTTWDVQHLPSHKFNSSPLKRYLPSSLPTTILSGAKR